MAKLKAEKAFGSLHIFSEDSMLSFPTTENSYDFKTIFRNIVNLTYGIRNQRPNIKTRILLPIASVNMESKLAEVKEKLMKGRVMSYYPLSSWRFRDSRRNLNKYCKLFLYAVERDAKDGVTTFDLNSYYKKDFSEFYICLDVLENTGVIVNRIVFDKLAHRV